MLIQSDKISVIFLYLQAKLQLYEIATLQDYKATLLCASENFFWQLFNLKKACFFAFAILRCCKNKKKAFTQADRAIGIKKCIKHAH